MDKRKATIVGLISIVFWSALVGSIRSVSEHLGAFGGTTVLHTVCSLMLLIVPGLPDLRTISKKYLLIGAVLFCLYEVCFTLALGLATDAQQTLEVSMVNYLWPTLIIVFAIVFNKQKANFLIVPGVALAFFGVFRVIGGDGGINFSAMLGNVSTNPVCYFLALIGAVGWAAYCTVTARMAGGKDAITLFFIITSIVLWLRYLTSDAPPMNFTTAAIVPVICSSISLAAGFATWNFGILHGHVTLLAAASYFIPIFSAVITAWLFETTLTSAFWQGAALVCVGSLLCWLSTRTNGGENGKTIETKTGNSTA